MSSINVNQILSRNINILKGERPLFINLKNDGFIQEYTNLYPQAVISYYSTNYQDYSEFKSLHKIHSTFSAQYKTDKIHDIVIIAFPKSKAELNFTLSMIAQSTNENTNIIIVGENKSGIKTINKATEQTLIQCQKHDSARHCLLFTAKLSQEIPGFNLDDWYHYYSVEIEQIKITVAALPGVFSQNGLDKGTKILLEHLPAIKSGELLDFGCGAGVIATYIGKKHSEVKLNLVDVNALAIASSNKTLELNNLVGNVFASNSLSDIKNKYDVVVSNPPFHQGVATNYTATENFLKGIKSYLRSKAYVIIVANSFLKYEPIMKETIGQTSRLVTKQGFTIYKCE